MTQPLNRDRDLPQIGELDSEAGEFWVENPFMMSALGINLSAFERNCFYLNLRGDSFLNASFASAADIDSDSRSVIAADFDRDGRPDLLVGSDGGGPLRLFLNRMPSSARRVRITLVGTDSNRAAIGSRVVLHCGGRQIVRDVFAPNGFIGQGPVELLVGVGEAEVIDTLSVRWPTGQTEQFTDLQSNTQITITEGAAAVGVEPMLLRR